MQVDQQQIKQLRQQRGWTQQHLCDACGVSLRTIQRVEKFGNASHETVLSICAVFEIDKQALAIVPDLNQQSLEAVNHRSMAMMIGVSLIFGSVIGASLMYLAVA